MISSFDFLALTKVLPSNNIATIINDNQIIFQFDDRKKMWMNILQSNLIQSDYPTLELKKIEEIISSPIFWAVDSMSFECLNVFIHFLIDNLPKEEVIVFDNNFGYFFFAEEVIEIKEETFLLESDLDETIFYSPKL